MKTSQDFGYAKLTVCDELTTDSLHQLAPGDIIQFKKRERVIGNKLQCTNISTLEEWLSASGKGGRITWMPKGRFYSFRLRG